MLGKNILRELEGHEINLSYDLGFAVPEPISLIVPFMKIEKA